MGEGDRTSETAPSAEEIRSLRGEVAALRDRNAVLQSLLDLVEDAVFVKDLRGRYQLINAAGARLLGRSVEEVIDREDTEFFESEAAGRIVDFDRRVIAEGTSRTVEELATSGGIERIYRTTKAPHRDRRGAVIGIVGVARDISGPKRAEEELREMREFLSHLLDHTPAPIYVTDRDGRACLGNRAWADLWGLGRQDVVGRRLEELSAPEVASRFREQNRRVIEAGRSLIFDDDVVVAGAHRHFFTVKFPLRDASNRIAAVGGISLEITERKRAEDARREYADRLKVLSRRVVEVQEEERRHLARELHDEIGQALTAIGVNLQAIRRSSGPASWARLEECLGVVQRTIEQVRSLALDLRPSMLDDLGLVAALRWYLDGQARRVGYEGRFSAYPDEIRLSPAATIIAFRVAQEALTNVARHARARRVRVWLRIRGGTLHLVVRDDGIGFDTESTLRRDARGEALGLLGMRERAALLGGRIVFRSIPGRKTDVHLMLPIGRAVEDSSHGDDPAGDRR